MYFVNFRIQPVAETQRDVVMTVGNIKNKRVKIDTMYRKKNLKIFLTKRVTRNFLLLSQRDFNTFWFDVNRS